MQNPSSIALAQIAMRQELPNNLSRAQRKIIGFCAAREDFRRNMQIVSHTRTTTSILTERKLQMQNPKNTEHQTIVRPERPTTSAKPALPPHPRAAQNPGGEF